MKSAWVLGLAFTVSACASKNTRTTASDELTVWSLQEMAQEGRFDELNDLFDNHGIKIDALPTGYAAGTGARVLDLHSKILTSALDGLTGKNWRGKIFFHSPNPRISMGLNRIKGPVLFPGAPIVPQASFVTEIVDHHPLTPTAKSNLVLLNYSEPKTTGTAIELILKQIQVLDVVVPVKGKYGPIYIGKTFIGEYLPNRRFRAFDKDKLIAWFFLDFSPEAVAEQKEKHWDGSREKTLDPVPTLDKAPDSLADE